MKELFTDIYKGSILRPGADALLDWIEKSDFFTAPASSRYHLAEKGGLVAHSVNVYYRLRSLYLAEKKIKQGDHATLTRDEDESCAVCGLLHDICKANFYKVEMRNRKNEQGQWEKYPFYVVDDQLPYGHGEKSVYIISAYMKLSREEAMAIRWHMGGWNEGEGRNASQAFEKYPLAVLTHIADLEATYLDEAKK